MYRWTVAKGLELAQYADRTRSVLECLRVVSETMPGGMDLNQFAYYKGNKLELRGDADASEKVYSFIQTLEQTGLFTEVTEDIKTDASRPGRRTTFSLTCRLPGAGDGVTRSPMPGLVKAVHVTAGQAVSAGDRLAVLEAMKMEHSLTAAADGVVAEVLAQAGDQVEAGAPLIRLEPVDG